jgi:conjugative relaxase-like TrwC/TraI family protein
MVMTIAKITADGYTYLTRHTACGDSGEGGKENAAAYYTAQGNPPGRWLGRGAPLLALAGQEVTEEQMLALFGHGAHPGYEAMMTEYFNAHARAGMTDRQKEELRDAAIRHTTLGRQFPAYETVQQHGARVAQRLGAIRDEAGREPTPAEEKKIKAEEARRQRAAVAGFDLVFSPVKSAALLWALDERPRVRDAIRAAHEEAMAEALELLEDHAAYTRTGTGGIAQIATNGLIATAFEHWDSRAGDPNLHTHVAVSSKVQGVDGKWRSLDSRGLYRMSVAVSEAYNTAFEARLTRALGVRFTARPGTTADREPVREIDGVPLAMIAFFSRRRAAIEKRYDTLLREYRDRHGHDPAQSVAYQLSHQATLETRPGKKPPRSLRDKRAQWREELDDRFGADAATWLMAAVPAQPPAAPERPADTPSLDDLAERTVASVSLRRSTWTVWNVRAEAERLIRTEVPFVDPERHRELADAVTDLAISPHFSILVEAPSLLDEPPELRRADGESVFTEHRAGRYTRQAVLDAEQRLLNATRTPTVNGVSGPKALAALDGFEARSGTSLDDGQRSLVTSFACDERLLLAGIGPAGSGKTTAMRAYAHVLRHDGRRLVPLATSAAAADVLGRELGGVQADNLHKFMHEWTTGKFAARLRAGEPVPSHIRTFALHPGDVVLVDEAGMAGTFPLDTLVQLAAARGAVVRLLGDDRQLSSVESGGALRLVASQPGTPHLSVLHRFRDPAEAAATLQVRAGDGAAVDWYAANGRVRGGSREAMTQAAYDGWKHDMLAGKVTLMAAWTSDSVTGLSAQARADRVTAGQVEAGGVTLHDGNTAGAGDWIVTRRNDRRLSIHGGRDWVKNGDAWHVLKRLDDGALIVRNVGHGGRVTLPPSYVRDHVELLYATTAHRAQGDTVDTAHPLITAGMSRETLYVLASRAREKTTLYVATHDLPFDEDPRVDRVRLDPRAYAAREVLLNIIATEGAALPAMETITIAQEQAGSLATLVPRYLHVAHQDAQQRYADAAVTALGAAGGTELAADSAWHAVVRRLYEAEGSGWDPAKLLTTVAGQRELGSADSIAEVLSWRLDAYLAGNPVPPRDGDRPYESEPAARKRLAEIATTTLGPQLTERAEAERAWPALIAALRRADNADTDPAELLSAAVSAGEVRTARSISEILAWRITRRLATCADAERTRDDAGTPTQVNPSRDGLLPWVAGPLPGAECSGALGRWLNDAADLITARVDELAGTAVRHRPPWMLPLGQPPADPERERQWNRHIAIIAAYRDQHQVTTDDLRQVLGPYPEQGKAGHKAYWHAAESILVARRLAGLDAPVIGANANAQARAQVAADIYRALPQDERTAISNEMATKLGMMWFGDRAEPDEDATTRPVHAVTLIDTLAAHGHMTSVAESARRQPAIREPVEAELARRGPKSGPSTASRRAPGQGREVAVTPAVPRCQVHLLRPDPIVAARPQQQL